MKLILANDQQKLQRDYLTFEAWGERLTLPEFLKRETALRLEPWCLTGMKTWVLQDGKDNCFASCETFDMKSYYYQNSLEISHSVGIGSVFVEPKLRGKGYSTILLKLLIESLRAQQSYHAAVLFSEVGESIYNKCGFRGVKSVEWRFPFGDSPKVDLNIKSQFLSQSDLNEIRVPQLSKNDFCILPEVSQLKWHFKRQDIYAELLKRRIPEFIGSKIGASSTIWMVDYKYDTLRILLLNASSEEEASVLLNHAIIYARELGLNEVRVWGTSPTLNWIKPKSEGSTNLWRGENLYIRDDSIAMICPLSSGLEESNWIDIQRGIWI